MKTLIDLQKILGEQIDKVINSTPDNQAQNLETAGAVSMLAKQMINNADVILRTDKLSNRHDRSDKIAGDLNA